MFGLELTQIYTGLLLPIRAAVLVFFCKVTQDSQSLDQQGSPSVLLTVLFLINIVVLSSIFAITDIN